MTCLQYLIILTACNCASPGSANSNCNSNGVCTCNTGYTGNKCDSCAATYYMSGGACTGNHFLSSA